MTIHYSKVPCSKCKSVKNRHVIKKFDNGHDHAQDETGSMWSGNVCPDCQKDRRNHKDRAYRAARRRWRKCQVCDKVGVVSKYCSVECRNVDTKKRRQRLTKCFDCDSFARQPGVKRCLECDGKYQKKREDVLLNPREPNGICQICEKEQTSGLTKFCGKCSPSNNRIRRLPSKNEGNPCKTCGEPLSKRRHRYCSRACQLDGQAFGRYGSDSTNEFYSERKPKHMSWRPIQLMYERCPDGHELDHIIPLRHELVSGLHVPWNMQYLPVKENRSKGNKFDGTNDNNSWRTET